MTRAEESVPRRKEGANTAECGGIWRISVSREEKTKDMEIIRAGATKNTGKLEVSRQKYK